VLDVGTDATTEKGGEGENIVHCTVSTRSPEGATFDATFAKLL